MINEIRYYNLSTAQRRLWKLSQSDENSTAFNLPAAYYLNGDLNAGAFDRAFRMLTARHESLRTVFKIIDEEPKQEIVNQKNFPFKVEEIDLREDPRPENRAWALANEYARHVFDLSIGPLIRAVLFRFENEKYLFLLITHHIISDNRSMEVLVNDLAALYNGALNGRENPLSPLNMQYKDFSAGQSRQLKDGTFNSHRDYWLEQFKGPVPVLELPYDYPRPKVKTYNGAAVNFLLPFSQNNDIGELNRRSKTTVSAFLTASVKALLYRYTSLENIVVGFLTSGRYDGGLEDQVGLYADALALRTVINGEDCFDDLPGRVNESLQAAREHRLFSFHQLAEALISPRDPSRSPLFDVALSLENLESLNPETGDGMPAAAMEGVFVESRTFDLKTADFDLSFEFARAPEGISVELRYNTDLFKPATIDRLGRHYRELFRSIVENSGAPIYTLEYLPEEEKEQLLHGFNDTHAENPDTGTIPRLFVEQVEKTPDRIALLGPGPDTGTTAGDELLLSYKHLNKRSSQLARLLIDKGVKPGDITGILLNRSVEMIVVLMAILKAGGVYLPIDSEYPEKRNIYMLRDSGARMIVTTSSLAATSEAVATWDGNTILLDLEERNLTPTPSPSSFQPGEPVQRAEDPAYVIYTSGSTGKPKGVLVQHYSVVNLAFSQARSFNVCVTDRILQFSSICFDASVEQMFITLLFGACLVMVDKNLLLHKKKFNHFIASRTVNHIHSVPSFLHFIDLREPHGLKRIVAGGDLCPVPLAKKMSGLCDFINEYGPTETTVTSIEMIYRENRVDETMARLPIGRPLENTTLYVLDKWLNIVPIGVVGELYIGGKGVAPGYLNKPDLTGERFVFLSTGERVYRTGDLVRRLPDGNMDFRGRVDHQVKIRGFRIELGEIENILLEHPHITEAVVAVKKNEALDYKYLCAYLVSGMEFKVTQLREYLLTQLPGYMIPAYFVKLEEIPLSANRKVDRSALPDPLLKTKKEYIAPAISWTLLKA